MSRFAYVLQDRVSSGKSISVERQLVCASPCCTHLRCDGQRASELYTPVEDSMTSKREHVAENVMDRLFPDPIRSAGILSTTTSMLDRVLGRTPSSLHLGTLMMGYSTAEVADHAPSHGTPLCRAALRVDLAGEGHSTEACQRYDVLGRNTSIPSRISQLQIATGRYVPI
jgi:hypothetical protein